ncbi:MAG: putative Na+/H+ antiporter [Opitutales bacterium]
MKRLFFLFSLLCYLSPLGLLAAGGGDSHESSGFPIALEEYHDEDVDSVLGKLQYRIEQDPFNLVATIIFFMAILHTFMAGKFMDMAHKFHHDHEHKIKEKGLTAEAKPYKNAKDDVSFKSELFHYLGEVEAIFGIWVVPLLVAVAVFHGWGGVTDYLHYSPDSVNYTEPMFVVIIMAIASTRPVMYFSEQSLKKVADIGKGSPAAWWLSILTIAPILGSFITEPAAMTIAAILLGKTFYDLQPSAKFSYATLGLLFVNISVGGTLTHFAAPPVLMVAGTWGWDMPFMFSNFGWKAVLGILIANAAYFTVFAKDFKALNEKAQSLKAQSADELKEEPVPFWITLVHLFFIGWTVFNLHYPPLFIGGFLFFLAFTNMTATHQSKVSLKTPMLVGFFLAGLVTHGGLQKWWIAPVLGSLSEIPLFAGSTILTAFNDNAAITYLASLVPSFATAKDLQYAVVAGAVTGGGLTVIANAPNPAGQSILNKYFVGGVSPAKLAMGSIFPTLVMAACFMFIR